MTIDPMNKSTIALLSFVFIGYLAFGYLKSTYVLDLVGYEPGIFHYGKSVELGQTEANHYHDLAFLNQVIQYPFILSGLSYFIVNALFVYLFALGLRLSKEIFFGITVFLIGAFAIASLFYLLSLLLANPFEGFFHKLFLGIFYFLNSIRLGFLAFLILLFLKLFVVSKLDYYGR